VRTVTRRATTLRTGPASRTAATQLDQQGIHVLGGRWAPQPADEPPQLPRNLPNLTDPELMDLFSQVNQWRKYLRLQLAAAETDESHAKARATSAEAIALARSGGKTVAEMKARAREDASYAEASALHADAYGYRKLVSALFENIESDCFLLSREITRRTAEAPGDRRNSRR
jgi:hypothetical protein